MTLKAWENVIKHDLDLRSEFLYVTFVLSSKYEKTKIFLLESDSDYNLQE